jgi:thymidylate kinase
MYGRGEALLRRWQREAATIVRVVRNRLRSSALRSSTRTAPRGGLLVALVGPDGAGKTTVAREITRWLSREVAVLPLYGGSGSGPASLTRRALQLVARAARAFRRPTPARARGDGRLARAENGGAALPGARALAYATWALALARERRRGARRARGARDRGLVVVADRYPQCQFGGLNDGPKLWHLRAHRSALLRWAAAREHEAYADVERLAPDLVVKLLLPAHVALRRKPDTPADRLHHKVRVVAALSYPPCTQVAETDATRPLNEVLLCIKAAIWRAL